MSIDVMNTVWKRAPLQGGDLLILLAIADNADDNGVAYPGINYLATKARMSPRNAQRCIRQIADAGLMKILPNAGPNGANKYKIDVNLLSAMDANFTPSRADKLSPPDNLSPLTFATEGVTPASRGGDAGVTLTIIEPSKNPQDAHACAGEAAIDDRKEDRKTEMRIFKRLVNNWPNFAGMSLTTAEREFFSLSPSDRRIAEAKRDDWIALLRKQGKDHTPAPSTYLKERLWSSVPDVVDEPVNRTVAPPFGKAWMIHALKVLDAGPASLPPMPRFLADQVTKGTDLGRREHLAHQARHCWPEVNFMFRQAVEGKGCTVSSDETGELPSMEAVAIDSRTFHAWQAAFSERGWPWLQIPTGVKFVWFPAGGSKWLEALKGVRT